MIEANAPVIVYKTKADYKNLVPILLNEETTKVLSFPGPGDLISDGQLRLPVELKKGYLLDSRGINNNSVFTTFTYEDYVELKSPPSESDFLNNIRDKDPFEEIYDCTNAINHSDDLIQELNKKIRSGFKGCTRIK